MADGKRDPKEPILREEYERRHQKLRDEYSAFARKSTRILTVLVVAVCVTGGLSAYLLNENGNRVEDGNDFSRDLSTSLVKSCENNGNPLRAAVREFGATLVGQIRKDMTQAQAFQEAGTYNEIFPNFDPDRLKALLEAQRQEDLGSIGSLQAATAKIEAVDCPVEYPPPTKDD